MSVSPPTTTGINSSQAYTGAVDNRAGNDAGLKPKDAATKSAAATSAEDERRIAETGAIQPPANRSLTSVPALSEGAKIELPGASPKGRPYGFDNTRPFDRDQTKRISDALADKKGAGLANGAHRALENMALSDRNLAYNVDPKGMMRITRDDREIWSAPVPKNGGTPGDWAARIKDAGNTILGSFRQTPYADSASPSAQDLTDKALNGIRGDIARPERYRWPGYAPGV